MHLRTLSLRNYRVYRSVDLEFPDGLIGIYGANGAGKSTLIESLRFAIYGDSRTDKWELRSAGVGDDVRVELVFEHEGNTYDVRRRLKERNLTPEVEVFLASVCAQQKELTSFATMVPGERRRLVLDLLGVSPVERALARVRERGRDAKTEAAGARAGRPGRAGGGGGRGRRRAAAGRGQRAGGGRGRGRGGGRPGRGRAGDRRRRGQGQGPGGAAGQGRPGPGGRRRPPRGGRAARGPGGRGRPARPRDRGRHRPGGRAGGRGRAPGGPGAGPRAGHGPGQPGHRPRGGQGAAADQRAR